MKPQMNTDKPGSEINMKPTHVSFYNVLSRAATTLALLAAVGIPSLGSAAETKQKNFASPEEASSALVGAAKAGDAKAMMEILGPGSKDIVQSGDAVADKAAGERFVKAFTEANKIEKSGDKAVLNVGKDNWPFPVPIVKDGAGWRFDAKAGKEEILNRRIGGNELSVVQVVQAYVDAQREYYLLNPQKDKLLHYAQNFNSSQGKRDGLYFPTKAGEKPSPLGPLVANARAEGYSAQGASGKRMPFHGYYYRILKSQGPDAPGGAYDYLAQGRMIGGHALIAWPATYDNSGVMTFMVNHDGVVYEKDLGPDTAALVQKITKFNPGKDWKRHQ